MILHDAELIERYTREGWWGQVTVDDLFTECVRDYPDKVALVDAPNRETFAFGQPQSLSFAQTDAAVMRLAAILYQAGVRKDSIVLVQLPNLVEIVIDFLACARLGAIVSPAMMAYGERDLTRIVAHIRPRCILGLELFKGGSPGQLLRDIVARDADYPCTVFSLGNGDAPGEFNLFARPGETELGPLRDYLQTIEIDANEILTLHWTSGTTGDPKCVPRSHNNWHATGNCCVDAGGLQHGDSILAPMQMVHTAGYSGMVMPWLELQGMLVLHQPFDMQVFLQQIQDLRINHTVTAPAMLNALLRDDVLDQYDVSGIRSILCGSAPLDAWMIADFKKRYGIEIINAFGSTEGLTMLSSPSITTDPQRRARYFPRFNGSANRSVTGVPWGVRIAAAIECKLLDLETGEEVIEPDVPAEFACRSPAFFPGYWTADGGLDREDFDADGFFRPGEIFEIAGEGEESDYYHYIDRLKDVINRGGVKIPVGELEAAIQNLSQISEAAAIGYPDDRLGEIICAVVALRPGAGLSLDELKEALVAEGLAKYMLPERLEVLTALPRNPTGKVLKRQLSQQLAGQASLQRGIDRH
ncbi:MAG TPA: class I adenylate-forming enzyme family protein [Xanthomonadales bacterium]|nr:class I adenylate-forming enzyme family protein [Xanthomonadales bacterium]